MIRFFGLTWVRSSARDLRRPGVCFAPLCSVLVLCLAARGCFSFGFGKSLPPFARISLFSSINLYHFFTTEQRVLPDSKFDTCARAYSAGSRLLTDVSSTAVFMMD